MGHRNGIFAIVALTLSSLALAGMVNLDAYSKAAQVEAHGYAALTQQVAGSDMLCSASDAQPTSTSAKTVTQ
jgi:hypothetical protein